MFYALRCFLAVTCAFSEACLYEALAKRTSKLIALVSVVFLGTSAGMFAASSGELGTRAWAVTSARPPVSALPCRTPTLTPALASTCHSLPAVDVHHVLSDMGLHHVAPGPVRPDGAPPLVCGACVRC